MASSPSIEGFVVLMLEDALKVEDAELHNGIRPKALGVYSKGSKAQAHRELWLGAFGLSVCLSAEC